MNFSSRRFLSAFIYKWFPCDLNPVQTTCSFYKFLPVHSNKIDLFKEFHSVYTLCAFVVPNVSAK